MENRLDFVSICDVSKHFGTVRAVDVAPTVLALLGQSVPGWMEGRPLDLGSGGSDR